MKISEKELLSNQIKYSWFETRDISVSEWIHLNFTAIMLMTVIGALLSLVVNGVYIWISGMILLILGNLILFYSYNRTNQIINSSVSWKLLMHGMEAFGKQYALSTEGTELIVEAYRETGLLARTLEQDNLLKLEIANHLKTREEARREISLM